MTSKGSGKSEHALRVMAFSTSVTRLFAARNQILNCVASPFGLTAAQVIALYHISITPACTPSALTRSLTANSASVTRLLDRLEDKGMIQRVAQERVGRSHDRRVVGIILTERGDSTLHALTPHWHRALSELMKAFKREEDEVHRLC